MNYLGHSICHFLIYLFATSSFVVPQPGFGYESTYSACGVSYLSRQCEDPLVALSWHALGPRAVCGTEKHLIQTPIYKVFTKCVVLLFCLQTILLPLSLVIAPFAF